MEITIRRLRFLFYFTFYFSFSYLRSTSKRWLLWLAISTRNSNKSQYTANTANKLYFQHENIHSWLCLYFNFQFFSLANFWRRDWNRRDEVSNEILPKLIPFISDRLKSNSISDAASRSAGNSDICRRKCLGISGSEGVIETGVIK